MAQLEKLAPRFIFSGIAARSHPKRPQEAGIYGYSTLTNVSVPTISRSKLFTFGGAVLIVRVLSWRGLPLRADSHQGIFDSTSCGVGMSPHL